MAQKSKMDGKKQFVVDVMSQRLRFRSTNPYPARDSGGSACRQLTAEGIKYGPSDGGKSSVVFDTTDGLTFCVCASEQYPENTEVIWGSAKDDYREKFKSGDNFPDLLTKILSDPSLVPKKISKPVKSLFDDDDDDEDDDDMDDDDERDEGYHIVHEMHDLLKADLGRVKDVFGEDSVQFRPFNLLNTIDVDFKIPLTSFDDESARALRIDASKPFIFQMKFSLDGYLSDTKPVVMIPDEQRGFAKQMKRILHSFVDKSWPSVDNDEVEAACKNPPRVTSPRRGGAQEGWVNVLSVLHEGVSRSREASNWLFSWLNSIESPQDIPPLDQGFLVRLMMYVSQRLVTLSSFCIVCDEPHECGMDAMLKPAVCSKDLCIFSYQNMGITSDALECLETESEVVDLLIVMAIIACQSQRANLIFDPYPVVFDPKDSKELALNPKNKDFDRVLKAFRNLPTMTEMWTLEPGVLRDELNRRDILLFPLLQWVVSSNRSHLVKLRPHQQLHFMETPHQFLLISSPPSVEAKFRRAREKHGSKFAFHGSNSENWHSILRRGLLSASGSDYQLNGALYGQGVYLSPAAALSLNFARRSTAEDPFQADEGPFLQTHKIACLALCEVIQHELVIANPKVWVMPNADYVATRFFFVYEHKASIENVKLVNTNEETFSSAFRDAMYIQP